MLKTKPRRQSAYVDVGGLGAHQKREDKVPKADFTNPMRSSMTSDSLPEAHDTKPKARSLFGSKDKKQRRPSAHVDEGTAYSLEISFGGINPSRSLNGAPSAGDESPRMFSSTNGSKKKKKKRRGSAQLDDVSAYLGKNSSFVEGFNPSQAAVDIALKMPVTFEWKLNSTTGSQMLCGWLYRLGSKAKWNQEWKKRYFVLLGGDLDFYTDESQKKQKGSIDLSKASSLQTELDIKDKHWPPVESRFRLDMQSEPCTLSVGDNPQDKKTWVESINNAIMTSQKDGRKHDISCEWFGSGSSSGAHCVCCGVTKALHFNSTPSSLGVSPLENQLEGHLLIHKKKTKITFANEWKKRMVKLTERVVLIKSEQNKDVQIVLNSSTKITRRSVIGGDDDDDGLLDELADETTDDKKGVVGQKWQFSIESSHHDGVKLSAPKLTIFSAKSAHERERWLAALIRAVKHCHSLASARLSQARNHKLFLEKQIESSALESAEVSSGNPTVDSTTEKMRKELLELSNEVKVLQRRRKENRVCSKVIDNNRAGVHNIESVKKKLSNPDPEWLARFLDKGSVELLAAKFHSIQTSDVQNNKEQIDTATNIMECFWLLSQSLIGRHYLSSINRESLHVLARALLVDGVIPLVEDLVPPPIHHGLFTQYFDMLENIVSFSGDGRQAVVEVLSSLSVTSSKPDFQNDDLDEVDQIDDETVAMNGDGDEKGTGSFAEKTKTTFSKILTQRYDQRQTENANSLHSSHTDSVYHPLDRPFASMVALLDAATTPEPLHSFREKDVEEVDPAALVMPCQSLVALMAVMVTFVVPNVSNQPARPQRMEVATALRRVGFEDTLVRWHSIAEAEVARLQASEVDQSNDNANTESSGVTSSSLPSRARSASAASALFGSASPPILDTSTATSSPTITSSQFSRNRTSSSAASALFGESQSSFSDNAARKSSAAKGRNSVSSTDPPVRRNRSIISNMEMADEASDGPLSTRNSISETTPKFRNRARSSVNRPDVSSSSSPENESTYGDTRSSFSSMFSFNRKGSISAEGASRKGSIFKRSGGNGSDLSSKIVEENSATMIDGTDSNIIETDHTDHQYMWRSFLEKIEIYFQVVVEDEDAEAEEFEMNNVSVVFDRCVRSLISQDALFAERLGFNLEADDLDIGLGPLNTGNGKGKGLNLTAVSDAVAAGWSSVGYTITPGKLHTLRSDLLGLVAKCSDILNTYGEMDGIDDASDDEDDVSDDGDDDSENDDEEDRKRRRAKKTPSNIPSLESILHELGSDEDDSDASDHMQELIDDDDLNDDFQHLFSSANRGFEMDKGNSLMPQTTAEIEFLAKQAALRNAELAALSTPMSELEPDDIFIDHLEPKSEDTAPSTILDAFNPLLKKSQSLSNSSDTQSPPPPLPPPRRPSIKDSPPPLPPSRKSSPLPLSQKSSISKLFDLNDCIEPVKSESQEAITESVSPASISRPKGAKIARLSMVFTGQSQPLNSPTEIAPMSALSEESESSDTVNIINTDEDVGTSTATDVAVVSGSAGSDVKEQSSREKVARLSLQYTNSAVTNKMNEMFPDKSPSMFDLVEEIEELRRQLKAAQGIQESTSTSDKNHDPKYAKYFKMLAMHLPRAAVEIKMMADGFTNFDVLDTHIGDGAHVGDKRSDQSNGSQNSTQQGNGTILKDDPKYAKYFKMLSMHLPRPAVEMKMKAEGVDPGVLDMDPNKPFSGHENMMLVKMVLLKDDPKYAKYFKMLSMHLPRPAVEMKMKAEGVDPSVLDMDPNKPLRSVEASKKTLIKDNPVFAKYFKMISNNIPREVVEMKMRAEGIDPKLLDMRLEDPCPIEAEMKLKPETISQELKELGPVPNKPTKAVYIVKVPEKLVESSLFGTSQFSVLPDSEKILKFTADLEERFPAPPKSKSGQSVSRARKSVMKKKKEPELTVIDPQRAMNLIIVMRKLGNKIRPVNGEDIVAAAQRGDIQFLGEEKVELLRRMALEPEEETALKAFQTAHTQEQLEKLRPLEKFLLCLFRIPRFQLKLESLSIVRNAPGLISGACVEVTTVSTALQQLHGCSALVSLLRLALHLSNFLNAGTSRVCGAIQLRSLERFTQMRGVTTPPATESSAPVFVGRTLMHFLAYSATFVCPEALHFAEELSLLKQASHCDLVQLQKEMVQIDLSLQKARDEILKWETELVKPQAKAAVTRTSRVQRGSVIFQGMANLIGEEPSSVSEQDQEASKQIKELKESLKESESSLKQVREDFRTVVELSNRCRTWFGEALLPVDEKPIGEEGLVDTDKLIEVKEWLTDAQNIIDSFQNACIDNKAGFDRVARAMAQQQNDLKQQQMRQLAKAAKEARELAAKEKALATALSQSQTTTSKVKSTNLAKRNIVATQTNSLRAKRNSIAQHSKRNSVLLGGGASLSSGTAARQVGKRNSIANMLKPVQSTQRSSSGGMMAAMKSIRGSVAGDSEDDSDDDWDSD